MHLNKDAVFIVTTVYTYFVTRYFSNIISDNVYTTTNRMLTHIPKFGLLCKQFIVHVAEKGYRD
jgi:hypothetical protein